LEPPEGAAPQVWAPANLPYPPWATGGESRLELAEQAAIELARKEQQREPADLIGRAA
jgi:hypothetical protein